MSAPRTVGFTRIALLVASLLLLVSRDSIALNQPNGDPIPSRTDRGLQTLMTARGEMVDVERDAAVMPERFVPGCRLTFNLVTRGPALFRNSFGWYNATGRAPTEAELHALIPCDAGPGFVATLDLTREPAYAGGEIGFFLRTPEDGDTGRCAAGDCCGRTGRAGRTYFSERRFNPDSIESGGSGYIHLVTYDSRVTRDAFYFAWEDLFRGGDNNFTDFVALVSNIVCAGGGMACNTAMPGVCSQGVQQCRAGTLTCVPTTRASPERCDGLDNDCNGVPDDGSGLCPAGRVCERGVCVPMCVERACFSGFRCSDRGTCVEDACVGINCPSGQRCVGGRCVGACDGIRCPGEQQCRAGRCVNPCEGVTCDMDQVCVGGTCVPRCQCRRCSASETCGADGRCLPSDCARVVCPAGERCASGACRGACEGATCPAGERCEGGACVMIPAGDGGAGPTDSGTSMDAGGTDATAVDAGAMEDGAVPGGRDAGVMDSGPPRMFGPRPSGCECRAGAGGLGGERRGSGFAVLGALSAVCLGAARTRRRSAR